MKRIKAFVLIVFSLVFLQGCQYFQRASIPMEFEKYVLDNDRYVQAPELSNRSSTSLLVMLPGIAGQPNSKTLDSILKTLEYENVDIDVLDVNANFAYYRSRILLERLKADIVDPALTLGYEKIHFMGVSLGGYGALLYLREFPDDVTSAMLLAPYLGEDDEYVDFVNSATPVDFSEGNLWPWLSTLPPQVNNKIFLAYGLQDDFSALNSKLAEFLDDEHVFTIEGEHRWTTWLPLWQQLTANNDLW
ncbi:lipase family protein [Aurantivibrio infirmus]